MRRGRGLHVLSLLGLLMSGVAGCHYYEQYRVLKTTADVRAEQAELLKAYRLCLARYEDDPSRAKERCAVYTQRLREVEISHPSSR